MGINNETRLILEINGYKVMNISAWGIVNMMMFEGKISRPVTDGECKLKIERNNETYNEPKPETYEDGN